MPRATQAEIRDVLRLKVGRLQPESVARGYSRFASDSGRTHGDVAKGTTALPRAPTAHLRAHSVSMKSSASRFSAWQLSNELMERLRTATGDQLPARLKEEIRRELRRLALVLQIIKAIKTERDAIASANAATHTNAKKIQKLVKLQSIRAEFRLHWLAKVFFRPFTSRHQVASR